MPTCVRIYMYVHVWVRQLGVRWDFTSIWSTETDLPPHSAEYTGTVHPTTNQPTTWTPTRTKQKK